VVTSSQALGLKYCVNFSVSMRAACLAPHPPCSDHPGKLIFCDEQNCEAAALLRSRIFLSVMF
jgi:hypothetical protein